MLICQRDKRYMNPVMRKPAFYTPPLKKVWPGIMLYPPFKNLCLSVGPSVRPSVSASFPLSILNIFLPIFFKLCTRVDIRKEWFGIVDG